MITRDQTQQIVFEHYKPLLASAKLVVPMQWDDPQGDSPVVFIQAEGTEYRNLNNNYFQVMYLIGIHVLVLDSRQDDDYVTADADAAVNALNQEIVENFEPLLTNENWQRIEWAVPSQVTPKVEFGGSVYRHEQYVFRIFP